MNRASDISATVPNLVHRALEAAGFGVRRTAPSRWVVTIHREVPEGVLVVEEDSLVAVLHLGRAQGGGRPDAAAVSWEDLLRCPAALPGNVRFALEAPDDLVVTAKSMVPGEHSGACRAVGAVLAGLSLAVRVWLGEVVVAGLRWPVGPARPEVEPGPGTLEAEILAAGWPAHRRADGMWTFDLEAACSLQQARLYPATADGPCRLLAVLAEWPALSPLQGRALGLFLLRLNALLGLARAVVLDAGDGEIAALELAWESPPDAEALLLGLESLRAASFKFAAELDGLREEALAACYLEAVTECAVCLPTPTTTT